MENNTQGVTIIGFGSLLSETSSRRSFPNLSNFRVGRLKNYRRIFAHTAPVFFKNCIARLETKEISSLSAEYCEGEEIIVVVFEIPHSEFPAFYEREEEFLFEEVEPETLDGKPMNAKGIICCKWNDQDYKEQRLHNNEELFHEKYGRWGVTKVWDDEILPCRVYLRHCVLAAQKLGTEAHNNFLDHTYLGDRKTTIRMHLEKDPSIMAELPPPELAQRYGG